MLDAYANVDYKFTDTAELPGTALASYLRTVVEQPTRGELAVQQIDDLIATGIGAEEIADDVDILSHIEPPPGSSVEDCLAVTRAHITRALSEPASVPMRIPETSWEWAARFPEVHHVLGAHFHQDFSSLYASYREALDDYIQGTPRADRALMVEQMRRILREVESESDLQRAADGLGVDIRPPQGTSLRQWFTDIADIVRNCG